MARVEIKEPREQEAHFGLYRTSAGGDESIIVRRKVGEPTDYTHKQSRKLKRQRDNLTLASQHYSHLSPRQKAITRHQFEEVEYQKSHGKTDTKLLSGRQLFISKEMHSLETTQKQLVLPHELCIMLVDEDHEPLSGELWLRYLKDAEWLEIWKEELATGNWLFTQTPRGQEAYRPYGEADGYHDPELESLQYMTESQLLAYRYHILQPGPSIKELLYQLPYEHTHFACMGFYIKRYIQPTEPLAQVAVYTSITSHGFHGKFTVGIKDLPADPPPEEWIVKQDRLITWRYFRTYNYLTILPATALNPGTGYFLYLMVENVEVPYWWGYYDYWLLTDPIG